MKTKPECPPHQVLQESQRALSGAMYAIRRASFALRNARNSVQTLPEFQAVKARREAGDVDATGIAWELVSAVDGVLVDIVSMNRELRRHAKMSEPKLRQWVAARSRRRAEWAAGLKAMPLRPRALADLHEGSPVLGELRAQGQALARLEATLRDVVPLRLN